MQIQLSQRRQLTRIVNISNGLHCFCFQVPLSSVNEKGDQNFKRKLSKREKKELKKKEKLSRMKSDTNDENRPVAEKLYTG